MGKFIREFSLCHARWRSIWQRPFFRFTASTRKARSSSARKLRRGASCYSSSASSRPAWSAWRPAVRRIIGARQLVALGHEVKLIPPAHVKPYVRRNKTMRPTQRRSVRRPCAPVSGSRRCVRSRTRRGHAASSSRAIRRPAHGASECVARSSERDRGRGGPGRPARLSTEAHAGGRRRTKTVRFWFPSTFALAFAPLASSDRRAGSGDRGD